MKYTVIISVIAITLVLFFLTIRNNLILKSEKKNISIQITPTSILLSTDTRNYDEYIVITLTLTPTLTPTPTPVPTITPTPISYTQLEDLFTKYSGSESISRELLRKIAVCESGLNPNARNGIYGGLFQFSEGSWITTRRKMNMDTNPNLRFDLEQSIRTAAFKMALDGPGAWPNCKL